MHLDFFDVLSANMEELINDPFCSETMGGDHDVLALLCVELSCLSFYIQGADFTIFARPCAPHLVSMNIHCTLNAAQRTKGQGGLQLTRNQEILEFLIVI